MKKPAWKFPGMAMNDVLRPLFIAGPTASGKSSVALELALMLDAEIVSADAYQVYRGMSVLTASPSGEERTRIPHHMVGFLDPSESWDASSHYRMAMKHIRDIHARGRRAIVVGGSGLYLKFLSHGMSDAPPSDERLRKSFTGRSLEDLVDELTCLDPEGAAMTSLENRRYVERNLEIVLLGGKPLRYWKENWQRPAAGPGWVLVREPEDLECRICERTKGMFEHGVVEEVSSLATCSSTAERTLGLSGIRELLNGGMSREECILSVALATRQYAKRQRTWLRRETWLEKLPASENSSSFTLAAQVKHRLEIIERENGVL